MSLLTQFYNCPSGGGGGATANEAIGSSSAGTIYAILSDGTVVSTLSGNFAGLTGNLAYGPSTVPTSASVVKEMYCLNTAASLLVSQTYSNYTNLEKIVASGFQFSRGNTVGVTGSSKLKTLHIGTIQMAAGGVGTGIINFSNNSSLSDVKIAGVVSGATTLSINFSTCALSQASVDGILQSLVLSANTAAINSGSTINLGGVGNSAPSAVGTTYKNMLTAAPFNATVLTN